MKLLDYFELPLKRSHLDDKELYLLMGYGNNTPSEEILMMIEDMFYHLQQNCKSRCGYFICNGKRQGRDKVEIENLIFHTGAIIATAMKEAEMIAVFTVTLGEYFDLWLHQLRKENKIVEEFVANSLGSVLAEGLVNELITILASKLSPQGLDVSNNYSPGYCSWPLAEQRELFSLFPKGITGIELTDSCLMLPIKSVSGIVAIGKEVIKRPYKCSICTMQNCIRKK